MKTISTPRIRNRRTQPTAEQRAEQERKEQAMIDAGEAVRCPECGCVVHYLIGGMCTDCDAYYC